MTTQRKPKRKLSNIDFSKEGAHIALVSKDQGGPANGADYALVMKGSNFSEEFIEKVQQVKVTLELPDFLNKFFHLYGTDCDILARMMGYVPEEKEDDSEESYEDWRENYIQSQLESYELMKAVHTAENIAEVLSKLSEDEYMSLIKDQEKLEKALVEIDKAKEQAEAPKAKAKRSAKKADTSVASEVNNEGVSTSNDKQELEKSMKPEQVSVEMVEKSVLVEIQKAFDAQAVELQKALGLVKDFEAKEKAAVEKARFELVKAAVKDDAKAEVIFKGLKLIESDEDFKGAVEALGAMQVAVEKSALFSEQGATVDQDESKKVQESAVAKVIKAQQAKAAK